MTETLNKTRRLTLIRDPGTELPELWLKVYVSPGPGEGAMFNQMFARAKCKRADSPEDADVVVFGGGADVDPVLYGETPHSSTHIDPARDTADLKLYKTCLDNGIPMIGVCRGAQFLHVMNGGKLFQDVNHHYGEHSMWDIKAKVNIPDVSSVHHQMCRPNPGSGMEIVAEAHISDKRAINDTKFEAGHKKDIESYFYRDTCCFGVQGHPEYTGYPKFTKWFLKKIEELIIHNPDIRYISGLGLRIHPDILELRKDEWAAAHAAQQKEAN